MKSKILSKIFQGILFVIIGTALVVTGGVVFAERVPILTPGISQIPTVGSCATGTTTLFAIPNPHAATSTVFFGELYGTQGATTTDIVIGTSTAAGISLNNTFASGVKENYFALTKVATSSQFFAIAGQTKYSPEIATTTNANGVAVVQANSITVGPNEMLFGYSTSTFSGSGNGNTTASTASAPSSCTYKFIWIN